MKDCTSCGKAIPNYLQERKRCASEDCALYYDPTEGEGLGATLEGDGGGEWVSVEDRLPENKGFVLLGYFGNPPHFVWSKGGYVGDGKFYDVDDLDIDQSPTHWMIPAPPKDGAE